MKTSSRSWTKNLIKGGSLENAIVVRGDAVLSKEPLRFADEFVRHKILDIIGDLALVGHRIRGHVIAVKPGHGANAELARALAREQARRSALAGPHPVPIGEGGLASDEVMQILPHRYPFLLVDRIIGFEGETKVTGLKAVTINEPFFQGHFPGHPVMPGVLQVEAMAQVASILFVQTHKNFEPCRLFHERGRREISQTGFSRRHADHSGGADQSARRAAGQDDVSLPGQRRGGFRRRIDVHVSR